MIIRVNPEPPASKMVPSMCDRRFFFALPARLAYSGRGRLRRSSYSGRRSRALATVGRKSIDL